MRSRSRPRIRLSSPTSRPGRNTWATSSLPSARRGRSSWHGSAKPEGGPVSAINQPGKADVPTVEELASRLAKLEATLAKQAKRKQKASIIMFSGDLDYSLLAFIIAIACLNMGMEVNIFFTFWGTHLLKDPKKKPSARN